MRVYQPLPCKTHCQVDRCWEAAEKCSEDAVSAAARFFLKTQDAYKLQSLPEMALLERQRYCWTVTPGRLFKRPVCMYMLKLVEQIYCTSNLLPYVNTQSKHRYLVRRLLMDGIENRIVLVLEVESGNAGYLVHGEAIMQTIWTISHSRTEIWHFSILGSGCSFESTYQGSRQHSALAQIWILAWGLRS